MSTNDTPAKRDTEHAPVDPQKSSQPNASIWDESKTGAAIAPPPDGQTDQGSAKRDRSSDVDVEDRPTRNDAARKR